MAYSNFTLETVCTEFQVEFIESTGIFSNIEPVKPSLELITDLEKKVPVAAAINTEKARSELIVANVLFELREQFDRAISFFSGIDFTVDPDNGLTGVCDFLVSLSPIQSILHAPVIVLVEAKKEDPAPGLGQCIAEMLAAQRFNAEKGNDIPIIYGAATTGTEWKFLKLQKKRLHLDMTIYQISQCDRILGILSSMVNQEA
ncbi:hypothetical protein C6497_14540 [Candidatus Poribacteria bacterium]|nr:MAG: hypothetical protein C6497_14540 [Candidatus Poribacteria bacterium]